MELIQGGVCAATGFKSGAIHSGIRKAKGKEDLALIVSDVLCDAAAVYTTNKVKADPLLVTKNHLENGKAQAIIVNSGNANACAVNGYTNAIRQVQCAANYLNLDANNVLVASTGVIGQELPVHVIEAAVDKIDLSSENNDVTAKAIMTTDTKEKSVAVQFEIDGVVCKLGGIAKGSGMIHPNMGTMLAFITTDCAVGQGVLDTLLKSNVKKTFNRVSVDGDTSTNDMCIVLSNGLAKNSPIELNSSNLSVLEEALHFVMEELAKKIAGDGEGAGKLMTCTVMNAETESVAETLAMSICSSSLVKAAMFGSDANWGRVLCAMGYSGADFDPSKVSVSFKSSVGEIQVCKDGKGLDFDEEKAKEILVQDEIEIIAQLNNGNVSVSCWGCDLTYDYVKINGDYRT